MVFFPKSSEVNIVV